MAPETPPWPEKFNDPCKHDTCVKKEATLAFNQANDYCRRVQNYYENQGFRASGTKFGIGILGTLAGAVFAPISTGSAATAWSGLSGATNGMQTSFNEAFSNQLTIKYRAAVVTAAAEGVAAYKSVVDPNDKVDAAISMARSCSMASALAEQQALKAISQDSISETGKRVLSNDNANFPDSSTSNGTTPAVGGTANGAPAQDGNKDLTR
ncbi:MAG: hypothetical protein ABIP37_00220 [Methylotenera sp.]